GDEMHGVGMDADHRYDGEAVPDCISCHEEQVGIGSGILQHEIHGTETMSCQTCHSVSYTNCTNCHVEETDTGIPFYSVESHELDFRIGYNSLVSNERPYRYTTERHVPIDDESMSFYGVVFANFDAVPTWKFATPHNIQRLTPQTESCNSCHGNPDVFLTEDAVVPEERAANASVIVFEVPPLPEGYENVITGQENASDAAQPAENTDGGFWGSEPEPTEAAAESDSGFWGSEPEPTEAAAESGGDDFWGGGTSSEDESTTAPEDEAADDFWGN
ncbi:MAG: hypothetical protein KC496_14290, partial [Anaerolineae bacterium]|nr:hypothetical protein [Anaerolineae bacterium]